MIALTFFLPATGWSQFAGGIGTLGDPYQIATPTQMQAVGADPNFWDDHFVLIADLDMSNFDGIGSNPAYNIIGTIDQPYIRTFDGQDHAIVNLSITAEASYAGLFGVAGNAAMEIKNIHLINPNIVSTSSIGTGALVGRLFDGLLTDCSVEGGQVSSDNRSGGMLGVNSHLFGDDSGTLLRCRTNSTVIGNRLSGGLVGLNIGGTISECFATGSVHDNRLDGAAGGLVGENILSIGIISQCYATGNVTGNNVLGGLVGSNFSGTINHSYAIGLVANGSNSGGLVGFTSTGVTNLSFWDVDTTGQAGSAGGTGLNTVAMQQELTYTNSGWDFVNEAVNGIGDIWRICDTTNYPKLNWQATLPADWLCPDGVGPEDLALLADQWLLNSTTIDDIAPDGGDGFFDLFDFAELSDEWMQGL